MDVVSTADQLERRQFVIEMSHIEADIWRAYFDRLDVWTQQPDPKPTGPKTVRTALRDWLTGLGLLHADLSEDRH